jgi:hypothetical protein
MHNTKCLALVRMPGPTRSRRGSSRPRLMTTALVARGSLALGTGQTIRQGWL